MLEALRWNYEFSLIVEKIVTHGHKERNHDNRLLHRSHFTQMYWSVRFLEMSSTTGRSQFIDTILKRGMINTIHMWGWDLPVGSSGLMKMLVAWESLCMNWAMLSVSFWAWPKEPIMVLRTPRTISVKSSGLSDSAAPGGLGVGFGPAARLALGGGGGGEKMGWEA